MALCCIGIFLALGMQRSVHHLKPRGMMSSSTQQLFIDAKVALSVCSCKQEPDNKEDIFRKEEVVADKVLLSLAVGSFYSTESKIWAGWAVRVHELIVLFITTYLEYHLVQSNEKGKNYAFLKITTMCQPKCTCCTLH